MITYLIKLIKPIIGIEKTFVSKSKFSHINSFLVY